MSSPEKVVEQFRKLTNVLIFMKKRSLFELESVRFHAAEVHLMTAVAGGDAINATAIAEKMGVTKGAISQTISRLEKKGVLTKTSDPGNKNELTLAFTDFGERAHDYYIHLSERRTLKYKQHLKRFSEDELMAVERFLAGATRMLEEI